MTGSIVFEGSRLRQLESEVALLQDTVAELVERVASLEGDPVVDVLRDAMEVEDV